MAHVEIKVRDEVSPALAKVTEAMGRVVLDLYPHVALVVRACALVGVRCDPWDTALSARDRAAAVVIEQAGIGTTARELAEALRELVGPCEIGEHLTALTLQVRVTSTADGYNRGFTVTRDLRPTLDECRAFCLSRLLCDEVGRLLLRTVEEVGEG